MSDDDKILDLELDHEQTVKVCLLYRDVYSDLANLTSEFFNESAAILMQNPETAKAMAPALSQFANKFRDKSIQLMNSLEKITEEVVAQSKDDTNESS